MRRKICLIWSLVIGLSAQAQVDSYRDFSFVSEADPWLTCQNAAGLSRYDAANIAFAEVSFSGKKGGLTNFDGSPRVLQTDAGVESFYRISQRTVVYGKMSYQNFIGKEMAGSAFIDNYHAPFDIVEDSLTNLGRKQRDTYHLTGSFASNLYKGISVGATIDYTAANYAKYKDLRHQNKLMDLKVRVGVLFPIGRRITLGANYQYERKTESVSFSTYGTADKVYKSLIDYAAFTGYVEQFGNEGYTDKSREMPLVNSYQGGSMQLGWQFDAHTQLFGQFTYAHRTGYYGRKSPYTITYTNHRSDSYGFTTRLSHRAERTLYLVDLGFDTERLTNKACTYHETKNASGATSYEYFSPVKTADKLWANYLLAFTIHTGIRNAKSGRGFFSEGIPTLTIKAGFSSQERKQTAYLYPYYRRQHLQNYDLWAHLTYNLLTRCGLWSFSVDGSFRKGEGRPYEDLTFTTPSDKQSPPPSMDTWLYREYQYLTSAQYAVGGQLKYAFIFPGTRLLTHIRLAASHRKANETNAYSNGCDRTEGTVAIGCTF